MEKYPIANETLSTSKRIYLESPILNPFPLLYLQNQIRQIQEIIPIPEEKFHLTLFHFGKLETLFNDFSSVNPGINVEEFMQKFYSHLDQENNLDIDSFTLRGKDLDLFEHDLKPLYVLRMQKSQELIDLRAKVLSGFREFVNSFGISEVEEFMLNSQNLRFQTEQLYDPHVSIGYQINDIPRPNINVSEINLVFGKPQLKNLSFGSI